MKALIVEDTKTTAKFVELTLRGAGFETATVVDGYQAIHSILQEEPLSIASVDLMLPSLDGFALLEWMRTDPTARCLPRVVCVSRQQ